MKCDCRLQISDMGYFKCELEEDHIGDHQFSHNAEKWPRRKYTITWERDTEKDFFFKEEHLSEINFDDVFDYIKDNYNILSYNYKFVDDSIHGSTPILWLNVEYFEDFKKIIVEKNLQEDFIEGLENLLNRELTSEEIEELEDSDFIDNVCLNDMFQAESDSISSYYQQYFVNKSKKYFAIKANE